MPGRGPTQGGGSLAYRPEIDGLRAIAVLPVALFHAKVPGFGGGFVGVDVFFVISGYLITGILLRNDGRSGRLARFYERRARRILPPLLPVLGFTLVCAWLIFIPGDFRRYSQALAATALFGSNVLFALRGDYFAGEAGFEPLVHTWSLGVEEQFYLLYPVAFLLISRRRSTMTSVFVSLALIASFATALLLVEDWPRASFNLLPTRAWELMAGALCATFPPSRGRELPAFIGIGAIVAGMIVIGPATPAPGVWFVLPVAGAALVVRYASADTMTGRALGWRPLVAVGLVSYGFYLWHQALLAFVFYRHFNAPPWSLTGATLVLALILAVASYGLIERPIRSGSWLASRRSLAAFCVGGLAAAALAGIAGHLHFLKPRSSVIAERLDARYAGPVDEEDVAPPGRELPFLLYGDSHARQYYPALVEGAGRGAMFAASACMALPDATNHAPGDDGSCSTQYRKARRLWNERRIPVVIWAQRWERYLYRASDGKPLGTTVEQSDLFRAELSAVRAALPQKTLLILVGNEPTAWAAGPHMDGGLLRCRAYRDVECPTSYPARIAEGRAANRLLRAFAAQTPGVAYVDAAEPLCPGGRCRIIAGNRLYYSDGSHLTPFAAQLVVARILATLPK
jgi:peptidoglycan/LPS O-acetylase OafA/YrhL